MDPPPFCVDTVLRPLVIVLALSGCYVPRPLSRGPGVVVKVIACFSLWLFYVAAQLYQCVQSVRPILAGDISGTAPLIIRFLTFLLYVIGVYISILFTLSCSRQLWKWSELLTKYCQKYDTTRRSFWLEAASWIGSSTLFVVLVAASVYQTLLYTQSDETLSLFSLIFMSVFSLNTKLWPSLVVYLTVFVFIYKEAKRFNRKMCRHQWENATASALQIEHYRLRHYALCQLVDQANVVLRHFLFVTYAGGILVVLLFISLVVNGGLDIVAESRMNNIMYLTVELCSQMVVVTGTGAILSLEMHKPSGILSSLRIEDMDGKPYNAMHKPSGILSSLRIEDMDGKPYNAVAAFQCQLQNGPIGFHVYHLFTIDTSTVLMIGGTVLTYVVVTAQLKPNDSAAAMPTIPNNVTGNATSYDG